MVLTAGISKILRRLERYFYKLNNFSLNGESYNLILITPNNSNPYADKYDWIISTKYLDDKSQKFIVTEILEDLKRNLTQQEYTSIARFNVLHSNSPLVNHLNYMFPFKNPVIDLNNIVVGGVEINKGFILKSMLLEDFISGHALTIKHKILGIMNIGLISINNDYMIKYYTAKALREMYPQEHSPAVELIAKSLAKKEEPFLIKNHYIAFINFDDIELYQSYLF